jgi:hypothetical protein
MIFGPDQKSESEIEFTDRSHENMGCGVYKVKILLCVLCVSVVNDCLGKTTTEAQRTQRWHREEVKQTFQATAKTKGHHQEIISCKTCFLLRS